jgi:LysM repeat protein
LIAFAVLAVLATLIQFAIHMARTEPRDTAAIAERELRVNTLTSGEQIVRAVTVFRRPFIDYFRATHGLLVLTNKRLIYLGLQPRDLLASPDMPPTFEERDFPIDTLVRVSSGRTFFGLAKAIKIETPNGTLKLGVTAKSWTNASGLIATMDSRHKRVLAEGVRQRELRARAEAARKVAEARRRKPQYYTVRRGDALGSIATQWNTTPEKLKSWNRLPGNTIKIGQTLMVRPAT